MEPPQPGRVSYIRPVYLRILNFIIAYSFGGGLHPLVVVGLPELGPAPTHNLVLAD